MSKDFNFLVYPVMSCFVTLSDVAQTAHNSYVLMTITISVLGDSLSVEGYGLEERDTWPHQLMTMQDGCEVIVHAKGGLLASALPDDVPHNYFGMSQYLGRAINTESSIYVIMLGANDVIKGFSKNAMVCGLTRIVKQLKCCSVSIFKRTPQIVLVPVPNFIKQSGSCARLERRRRVLLLPALKDVAAKCNCAMAGDIILTAANKHNDGTHLKRSGARIIAAEVKRTLDLNKTFKSKLKASLSISVVTPKSLKRGQAAARRMGKNVFMNLPRAAVREFASTHGVPFTGGSKEAERDCIIAKLGLKWQRVL